MDRSKLGQLIKGHWSDTDSDTNSDRIAEKVIEKAPALDMPTDDDIYQPPGEMVPVTANVSKLVVPTVQVDPWSVFWLVLIVLTGGITLLSYFVLTAVPPLPNCQQISLLSTDSQRLYCAKLGAESNELKKVVEAINLVNSWSEANPLYNDGQNLVSKWSQQLIKLTRKELIAGGDLDKAISTLKIIPAYSKAYPEAQKTIRQWDEQWEVGEDLDKKFAVALQKGDWYNCYGYLSDLQSLRSSYWHTTRHGELSLILAKEKEAWDKFEAAELTAQGEDPDAYRSFRRSGKRVVVPSATTLGIPVAYTFDTNLLAQAIDLAAKVPAGTQIKKIAQARRELWSQTLLGIATEKLNAKKYAEAIAAAKKVPKDVTSFKPASALAGQATNLLAQSGNSQPEVTPEIASGKVAVQSTDAQTLLAQAETVARSGSVESLSQAIAIVSKIPAGQPLWNQAQISAKAWGVQIQVIQDQPILDSARSLAGGGQLAAAISKVEQIPQDHVAHQAIRNELVRWREKLASQEAAKQDKSAKTLVPTR